MSCVKALVSAVCLLAVVASAAGVNNFMCDRYTVLCNDFMNAIGCESFTNIACNGKCANLTSFNGTCVCNSPFNNDVTSNRVAEDTWDSIVKFSIASLLLPTPGFPPYDFSSSFAVVCATAQSRLGCPNGKQTLLSQSPDMNNTYTCTCGNFDVGSVRAAEGVVDTILAPTTAILNNLTATPSSTPNFICNNYASVCNTFLTAAGCQTSVVQGCSGNTLDTFVGTCTCTSPFYFDISDGRVAELLYDSRVKPVLANNIATTGSGKIDFMATYKAVCTQGLNDAGCPSGLATTDFMNCSCGNFTTPQGRTAEDITDYILTADMAANKALYPNYASPCSLPAPTPASMMDNSGADVVMGIGVGVAAGILFFLMVLLIVQKLRGGAAIFKSDI